MVLSESGRMNAVELCEAALPQLRPRIVEAMAAMASGPGVPDELADEARNLTVYSLMCQVESIATRLEAVDIPEDRVIAFCIEEALRRADAQFVEIIAETTVMEAAGSCPPREEMH